MRWDDAGDRSIAIVSYLGIAYFIAMGLVHYTFWIREDERKKIMAAWECPKGTAYSVTYLDGSRRCQLYWRKG